MFTGIVQATGRILAREACGGDVRLMLDAGALDLTDVKPGDSIAVSGVCLTALELSGTGFSADVSRETLSLTTLGAMQIARSRIIGVTTDILFPVQQQEQLAEGLASHGRFAECLALPSPQGHDAFLVDYERFIPAVAEFLGDV